MAQIPVCRTLTRIQDKAFSTIKLPVAEEKTEDLRKVKKKTTDLKNNSYFTM